MKNKIYFLAILLFGLGFLGACSSDDDSGNGGNADLIVGKWQYVQTGTMVNGTEVLEPWDHECATKKDNVEFTSTGNMTDTYYYSNCSLESNFYTYTVEGNNLKITYVEDGATITESATIENLNATTLKISMTEVYNGTSYTYISVMQRI